MRFTTAAAFVATAAAGFAKDRTYYESRFVDHMRQYDLQFKDGAEFVRRLEIFAANLDDIESHNAKPSTYTLGVNQYTHLTWDEFRAAVGLRNSPMPQAMRNGPKHQAPKDVSSLPASVDWVSAGAVTGVKNQGQCGSCWTFSTSGAIEGAHAVKYGSLVSLSEQQIVDCDNAGNDAGCNGGLMDDAFTWVGKNGGLCTEADYPYVMGSWTSSQPERNACQTSCSEVAGTAPASFVDVDTTDAGLMSALVQQPVSVAIQANQPAFQSYKSGVLTGRCGTRLDHGVLAVGYGTWTDGTDYYKVKNSWGTSWGMDGYILIQRGASQSGGECGILDMASYPVLA